MKLSKLAHLVLPAAAIVSANASSYRNVYGEALQPCSSDGMAQTGYTRTGYCVDENDDQGSHHICIDLSSTSSSNNDGGNFCDVTGQSDWCSSYMPCNEDQSEDCPVQQWCVCQWAFASYLESAGGCSYIQTVVCDSINLEAVLAYKKQTSGYQDALDCLVERCGLDLSDSVYSMAENAGSAWLFLWGAAGLVLVSVVVVLKRRYNRGRQPSPEKESALIKSYHSVDQPSHMPP